MPVEQGLPWHPVATGLAGQAIPFGDPPPLWVGSWPGAAPVREYLILFATLAFISGCQFRPSKVLSPAHRSFRVINHNNLCEHAVGPYANAPADGGHEIQQLNRSLIGLPRQWQKGTWKGSIGING